MKLFPIVCKLMAAKPASLLYLVRQLTEKKPERKRKNLIRLGVDAEHAYAWSRSRKGGWAIAQSPIMGTTITVERLEKRGYISLLELYNQIKPNTALFPMT
jgi:RNA-directed DNA polymerase